MKTIAWGYRLDLRKRYILLRAKREPYNAAQGEQIKFCTQLRSF
ncbi:hypothetical protein YSA_02136 [Pseudomonas putida ND6]|uniref:Uncharacterized protein n=1 Tax=Pseudomonas putida ND6 TaxID=231023 RepID=I3UR06_PSEPU|nr:hypothetical protein YSA_02136 [Pseudomonas putida ND6]